MAGNREAQSTTAQPYGQADQGVRGVRDTIRQRAGGILGAKPSRNQATIDDLRIIQGMYDEEQARGSPLPPFEAYVTKMGYGVAPEVWDTWYASRARKPTTQVAQTATTP